MEFEKPDRVQKVIFLAINGLGLLSLCVRLIRGWHVIPWDARLWEIYLVVIFPLLWRNLLREKSSFSLLIGISLVLLGVLGVTFRSF
jgi:hypothetical protein